MKRFWAMIRALAPHICIICTGMMLTFLLFDAFNPYIHFVSHPYTKIVLWVWAVSALLSAILLIAAQRREVRRRSRARHEAAREDEPSDRA